MSSGTAAQRLNRYLNSGQQQQQYNYKEEESIYNIIPPEPVYITKPRRYHSRYPSSIDPTGSTLAHQTTTKPIGSNLAGDFYSPDYGHQRKNRGLSFGQVPGQQRSSPQNYMRKGEGTSIGTILRLPQIHYSSNKNEASFQSALNQSYIENQKCQSRNPSVPKRDSSPLTIKPQKKSIVLQNIVQSILSSPPKVEQPVEWLKKKNYGKVPNYLTRIKDQTIQEYQALKSFIDQEEAITNSQVYEMPQDELESLRQGLKDKWNELNNEYQKTSHIAKLNIDSKIQKRLNLEQQMTQIEKDIELLNRKRIIVDTTK